MSEPATLGAEGVALLRRLMRESLSARHTSQELQIHLLKSPFSCERIRGVIDQLATVRRTAHQVLSDLAPREREVGDV